MKAHYLKHQIETCESHSLVCFLVCKYAKLITLKKNAGPTVLHLYISRGHSSHVSVVAMLIPFLCLTAQVNSTAEVYGCLQSLWGFLKRHNVQLMEATHLCCWVSLLFGEQDDDMMEAAKALLSIFLHHR